MKGAIAGEYDDHLALCRGSTEDSENMHLDMTKVRNFASKATREKAE